MKTFVGILFGLCMAACAQQSKMPLEAHTFATDTLYACTRPLSQGRTSTCWAFASASLMESEWLARGGDTVRLSPMYVVRQKYLEQFDAYYYSMGREEIRNGSLGHTFLRVWREDGLVPLEAYRGAGEGIRRYDHTRLLDGLRSLAEDAVAHRDLPRYRRMAIDLLDKEMGKVPQTFTYKGREYTPRSFADSLKLNPADYVELTSFTHHPFYTAFILEVPDNWEHASYFNLPLDTLEKVVRDALLRGYTVAWDGDVSEETFSAAEGVALWPEHPVSQEMRQQGFEHFATTDDHMMHIVGTAHDEQGAFYFVLKNSYGRFGAYDGLLYMSEDYFRAKTVSVMLNRNALEGPLRSGAFLLGSESSSLGSFY